MNKKLIALVGIFALAAAPVSVLRAQEGPGGEEDIEISENGPGRGGGPGMRGPGGPGMEEGDEEGGPRQVTVKVRKMKNGNMGMFRGQEMGGGRGFLTPDETIEIIKKHDAAFAKKMADLKAASPAKYRMVMQMAGKMLGAARMEENEAMEKDGVRTLSLEFDVKELSRKYDKAADGEKAAVKAELKTKIAELFDLKSKAQEQRLKRMTDDLGKLQKKLEARKANKSKIVEQRVDQLTGEGEAW